MRLCSVHFRFFVQRDLQKCRTADSINEVGKQRPEAYIRKEMVRHVNPIVTIKKNKCTCDNKANDILRHALQTSASMGSENIIEAMVIFPLGQLL